MFLFAGGLLLWALATFGAVLPDSSRLIMLVWFSAVALLIVGRILKRSRLDLVLTAALVFGGLAMFYLGPKLGLWVFATFWAWAAVRENPHRVTRFFHFLLIIGMLEALMGLIQYFVAPGWIFGYVNVSPVSGTLINPDHFAGLLELFVPVCLGLGFIAVRRYEDFSRSYFYILCGAFISLALAFSLSKMGIFGFFTTMLMVSIALMLRKSQRRLAAGLALGLVAMMMAGALWIGIDVIVARYRALLGPDAIVNEGRAVVYRDTLRMIRDFPNGVGVGMYIDRFRHYQTFHPELTFDHAHNDYLETTAEWGLAVALPFWILIFSIEWQFLRSFYERRSIEEQGILLTCAGSVFAILVHSLADFNLQIPSNAILFFTFIGIGLGVVFPRGKRGRATDYGITQI